ncbi:MAG: epoxyqueuosine reductase QueH [Candidatus Paceibacterota bacterium]|jgi:hypothetical protein
MLLHTCCAPCALPIIDGLTSLTMASTELSRMSNPEPTRRIDDLTSLTTNPEPTRRIDDLTSLTTNPEPSRRIKYLLKEKKVKNLTLYFYNPNIYPEKEYQKRLEEVKKISKIYNLELIIGEYEHNKWLNYLKQSLPNPLESYSENEERCLNCFRFRLDKTAEFAKNNNFNEFSTTLSVNRFKNTKFMNNYGEKLAKEYNLDYVILDLDPYEAHKKEQELAKKYNLYSQKYCGCEFSQG